jgi:hypothetical protein
LLLVSWRLYISFDAALAPKGSALKGCQFENSSDTLRFPACIRMPKESHPYFWLRAG